MKTTHENEVATKNQFVDCTKLDETLILSRKKIVYRRSTVIVDNEESETSLV